MTERPFVEYKSDQTSFEQCDVCSLQQLEPATLALQEMSLRFQGSRIEVNFEDRSETITIPRTGIFRRQDYIRYQITDNGLEVSKRLGRKNKEKLLSYFLERTMEI